MESKSSFNLLGLVVVVVLVVAAGFALFPAISNSVMQANMTAVGWRGRYIYVAITGANTEREPLGLPPIWPADPGLYTNTVPDDIAGMNFTNSTDFFWILNDGPNLGTEEWSPYVAGFYFGQLAGAGVSAHTGTGQLMPTNNMWTIAKNVRDDMEDVVPILITRNVAAESMAAKVTDSTMKNRLYFDDHGDAPFSNQGAVLIRKGGGMFTIRPKHMTWKVIYNQQVLDTGTDNSGNQVVHPLRYLTPVREVTPSEEVYNSGARAIRGYWHYWVQDFAELIGLLLVTGAVPATLLLVVVLLIKIRKTKLAALSFVYWLFLLLSIVSYMCFPIAVVFDFDAYLLISLLSAVIFQVCGCCYLKSWSRSTGNMEAYGTAFKLMLAAPLFALAMLFILSIGLMP